MVFFFFVLKNYLSRREVNVRLYFEAAGYIFSQF